MDDSSATNSLARGASGLPEKAGASVTVAQLEQAVLERYPACDAESWDRTGLIVGDPDALVSGVAVALDPTCDAVRAAHRAGANVLLTHHPVFLDPPTTFSPSYERSDAAGVTVYTAITLGIALLNVHTALDASVHATRLFPRLLSLGFDGLLAPLEHDPDKGYGMLCSVSAEDRPFALKHLAARVSSVFGRTPRVWGDFETELDRVVIANGSASDFVGAALEAQADCLVCGEVRYHTALAAAEQGLAIVELGHDVSEFPLCALLAQAAVDAGIAPERVVMVDQSSNWNHPDAIRL